MNGGEIIREARQRAGLSQSQLARKLETAQSVIVRWERGLRSPTFETVVTAVRACGLELDVEIRPVDLDKERSIHERLRLSPKARVDSNETLLRELRLLRRAAKRSMHE